MTEPSVRPPLTEGRRVETLRRLAVPDRLTEGGFLDLLDLIRGLVGAERAAVTLVGARRARTVAAVGADAAISERARAGTLADTVVRDPDGAHRRVTPRGTTVAVPIVGPGGAVLGAVELRWAAEADVPSGWHEVATRTARQVADHLVDRAEREEFRRFVELSPDAIAVVDLEGELELVNPAMGALLGEPPAGLVGRSFLDLLLTSDLPRVTGALARVLAGREPRAQLDAHLRRRDGGTVPVSMSAGYLAGPHRSLQVIVRDLTERQRVEAERARLTEQLAQAHRFETVGQLASGLAHDLNNLLAVLSTNVELAAESVDDLAAGAEVAPAVEQLREDLDALQEASSRVAGLTRRLLAFAAERPSTPEPLDVGARCRAVASLLAATVGDHVDLEVEVEGGLPTVELDPVGFERALTNLVLNARDASPTGSTVRIAARCEPRPTVDGSAGQVVVVEVRDQGGGMSEQVRARAFDPLFTTRSEGRGTGLGLTTVLRFVEELGGEVHLDTRPGEGTCVALTLPVVAGAGPVAEAAGRVALLEPAARSRRVITAMLRAGGYEVEVVEEPEQLVALAASGLTAMVAATTDGGEDPEGWSVAAELAAEAELVARVREVAPQLPLVLLTTRHAERVDGVGEVLRKPFLSERLLDAVARVVEELVDPTA